MEAPELATAVEAGSLPPSEERLPDEPLVVEPVERAGVYGGTWRTAVLGPTDFGWAYRAAAYEHLMSWDPEWTQPIPNIAASVERTDDGTGFTFHLRRGMKWSDGEPFTADDIVFAYNDILLNTTLQPTPPAWLAPTGEPGTVDALDQFTVRFTFPEINGLFLVNIAQPAGNVLTNKPRHYLERFHVDHNPNIDQLVEQEGFDTWSDLFLAKADMWNHNELPRITPWLVSNPLGEGSRLVLDRNPYYWKVDPDGSQLPYIDRVVFDVVNDEEVMLLKATNGEIDMHVRHFNTFDNKPVLADSRDEGGYSFFDTTTGNMNYIVIFLNLSHPDAARREVFQNREFRIGLSHSIDRQELIDTVLQRQGEPWQVAPRPESVFYSEDFAKQYTEFDVGLANDYLDRAGYTERSEDETRLGPDGDPISFRIGVATGLYPYMSDALELVSEYWREVGIEMRVQPEDRSLWTEKLFANEHDGVVWRGDSGLEYDAILDSQWYLPTSPAFAAPPWGEWHSSNGSEGEEPPPVAREQLEIYDQLVVTAEPEERRVLFKRILEIAQEQFYVIGIALPPGGYGIVKSDFHNVLEPMPDSWIYPSPGPTRPEQYFIQE